MRRHKLFQTLPPPTLTTQRKKEAVIDLCSYDIKCVNWLTEDFKDFLNMFSSCFGIFHLEYLLGQPYKLLPGQQPPSSTCLNFYHTMFTHGKYNYQFVHGDEYTNMAQTPDFLLPLLLPIPNAQECVNVRTVARAGGWMDDWIDGWMDVLRFVFGLLLLTLSLMCYVYIL